MKNIRAILISSPLRFAVIVASALLSASPTADASEGVQLAGLSSAEPVLSAPSVNKPLAERTALLYREIFALQEDGAWQAADALLARLDDQTLLGHAQYQRYMHPTAYRSSYRELATWLKAYGDHPGAKRVYKLALKRRPRGAEAPARPAKGYMTGSGQQAQEAVRIRYRSSLRRSETKETVVRAWLRDLDRLGDRGRTRKPNGCSVSQICIMSRMRSRPTSPAGRSPEPISSSAILRSPLNWPRSRPNAPAMSCPKCIGPWA